MKKLYSIYKHTGYIIVMIIVSGFASLLSAQENNSFEVKRNITGHAERFGQKNSVEVKVMSNSKEMYSINVELDFDVPFPELKVFDDGAAVLVNSFEGSLTFYDKEGGELVKSYILKDIPVRYERSVYASVSGETLVITLSQPDMDYSVAQLYNKRGQIISHWQVQEKHVSGLCYSDQNQLLAISVYDWQKDMLNKSTVFFNSEGRAISRIPFAYEKEKFAEDGSLFIGYTNNACFVYKVKDNKISFQRRVLKDEMIIDVDYNNKEITIVTTKKPFLEKGKWYYQNPSFTRLNLNGKVIKKWQEKGKPFSR